MKLAGNTIFIHQTNFEELIKNLKALFSKFPVFELKQIWRETDERRFKAISKLNLAKKNQEFWINAFEPEIIHHVTDRISWKSNSYSHFAFVQIRTQLKAPNDHRAKKNMIKKSFLFSAFPSFSRRNPTNDDDFTFI